MLKRMVPMISILFLAGASASCTQVSTQIFQGFNFIATPVVPLAPSPTDIFSGMDILGGKLYRYDADGQGFVIYTPRNRASFGGVLLGDGMWLTSDVDTVWQFDGAPDGLSLDGNDMADMWISLPSTGFTMFGHPFNHSVKLADCDITDGTQTISFTEAVGRGWIDSGCWGWDAVDQGYFRVRPNDRLHPLLEPFHGYQIESYRDNLALIIPAYPK